MVLPASRGIPIIGFCCQRAESEAHSRDLQSSLCRTRLRCSWLVEGESVVTEPIVEPRRVTCLSPPLPACHQRNRSPEVHGFPPLYCPRSEVDFLTKRQRFRLTFAQMALHILPYPAERAASTATCHHRPRLAYFFLDDLTNTVGSTGVVNSVHVMLR